jgi:hypothetical protein
MSTSSRTCGITVRVRCAQTCPVGASFGRSQASPVSMGSITPKINIEAEWEGCDRPVTTALHVSAGKRGLAILRLRYADVVWAPELEHLVQCSDGRGHLGHATSVGARAQPVAHHTSSP